GFRLFECSSIDFVSHPYRQVIAQPFLVDTRLRLDPTGLSKDIGNAYEIIIGMKDLRPFQAALVLAWFEPGAAFGGNQDAGMFATLELEWNF
ncbi:MAG TPA: hypothetical protein PKA37_00955, partial [Planctomycetota bacterium]|nr:hypothetical protein [Planctomycetota bacterium]